MTRTVSSGSAGTAGTAGTAWRDASPVGRLSTAELTVRLTEQVARLAREETRAAVAELRGKGKRARLGAGLLGVAGALGLLGGGALVAGLVLLLAMVMPAWLAAFVVGAVVLVAAGVAALLGRAELRRVGSPIPERTAASIAEDAQAIRKGVRG